MRRQLLKAVVIGVVFVVVFTTLVDIALFLTGVFPRAGEPLSHGLALLATAYRAVICVAGAWLCARLAGERAMQAALVLGLVGTVLALIGLAVTWNKGLGPLWYPIALAVLALPQCWLGGRLYLWHATARNRK
jgi:hypothetical protein